ncbi:MAG TPA: 50S ribosomal protein L18, partial [Aigarchaeota archaeon]|nr:50S ribosomal protein L18 [Aigarchaeota archaeon]
MAHGPRYKVPRRRRREGKTNYYKRYIMVLSGKPRLVVRKTNKYIWVQIIIAKPQGDVTVAAAHSRELVKRYGWLGGTKNTSAAYLTGMLAALRALKAGINYAVLDIGLHRPVRGARVFAALKGA